MKTKFVHAYMEIAETISKLSTARRRKVGCIVVKNDSIIGFGYNGTTKGWDNNCEDEIFTTFDNELEATELSEKGWTLHEGNTASMLVTKPDVVHAEINAISKIAKSTESSEGSTMFLTLSPCIECAKAIFQSGISKVVYKNIYRNDSGIKFLQDRGLEVINFDNITNSKESCT